LGPPHRVFLGSPVALPQWGFKGPLLCPSLKGVKTLLKRLQKKVEKVFYLGAPKAPIIVAKRDFHSAFKSQKSFKDKECKVLKVIIIAHGKYKGLMVL